MKTINLIKLLSIIENFPTFKLLILKIITKIFKSCEFSKKVNLERQKRYKFILNVIKTN